MAQDVWMHQQPTKSVAIKQLPDFLTEAELADKLNVLQANFDDIRFFAKKGPYGKGHAFVDFISAASATEWMVKQNGSVSLAPGHVSQLMYSVSAASKESEPMWECMCGALNVERRLRCFKCSAPQQFAADGGGHPTQPPEHPPSSSYHPVDLDRELMPQRRDNQRDPRDRFELVRDPYGMQSDAHRPLDDPYRRQADPYRLREREDMFRERELYREREEMYRGGLRRDPYRDEPQGPRADFYRERPKDDFYDDRREMPRPRGDAFVDQADLQDHEEMRAHQLERLDRERAMRDGRLDAPPPHSLTGPHPDGGSIRRDNDLRDKDGFPARDAPGGRGREEARRAPDDRGRSDRPDRREPSRRDSSRDHKGRNRERERQRDLPSSTKGNSFDNRSKSSSRKDDEIDGSPIRGVPPPVPRSSGLDKAHFDSKTPKSYREEYSTSRDDAPSRSREGASSNRRERERNGYFDRRGNGDSKEKPKSGRNERLSEKTPAGVDDGSDQIGPNPCNTVLLRGLDGLSDERRILDSLAEITSLAPINCYVMRNIDNVSLGYAFMEFDNVANSKKIVEYFNSQEQTFEVDGKLLMLDFSKNTFKTIMAGVQVMKDRYLAEQKAAEEKKKREIERREIEKRDSELRQQQEILRKKAEEAQKELARIHQEKAAKIKEEKDRFDAKFGVEMYTGYTYEQDTGLYTEKGQMIPERCCFVGHSMANNLDLRIFDEKEIVPNGKLDDLVTAAVKLLDSPTLKSYRVCCYLFFGITDLLDVKQSMGYREVVLRLGGDTLLISKIDWAMKTLKQKGVMVVLCTFPPMSFAKHNQFLVKNGLTGKLEFKSKYPEMQIKLNEQVSNINKRIEEINCDSGVISCQLSAKLFVQEMGKGRYILKDVYLRDGLHPTSQGATLLNVELAQNMRKVKQGKRSPEWMMKSHQVKSGSKISFGIKQKKDEPASGTTGKLNVLENKRDTAANGSWGQPPKENNLANVSRRSRSPTGQNRSPTRHVQSSGQRLHSPRRRSRSPGHRSPKSAAGMDGKPAFPEAPVPKYKVVPVPKSVLTEDIVKEDPISAKKQGSFALSDFLGKLTSDMTKGNEESASEASMSMSPPGPEPDPDIVVIADDAPRPNKKPRLSPPKSRQRDDNYSRQRPNSRSRYRPHSRSRRRSRSRSRRRSEDRFSRDSRHSKRQRRTPDAEFYVGEAERFQRSKPAEVAVHVPNVESRFSDTSHTLLGDRPTNLLGDRPSNLLGDRPGDASRLADHSLFRLAQEQRELTGSDSFEQLKTLSNLNQLSSVGQSDSMKQALELQKNALSHKISDTIEQQKEKILKMMKAEKKNQGSEFDRIISNLQTQSYDTSGNAGYGYGFSTQIDSPTSQADNSDRWSMVESNRARYGTDNTGEQLRGSWVQRRDTEFGEGYNANDGRGRYDDDIDERYDRDRTDHFRSSDMRLGYGGYE